MDEKRSKPFFYSDSFRINVAQAAIIERYILEVVSREQTQEQLMSALQAETAGEIGLKWFYVGRLIERNELQKSMQSSVGNLPGMFKDLIRKTRDDDDAVV